MNSSFCQVKGTTCDGAPEFKNEHQNQCRLSLCMFAGSLPSRSPVVLARSPPGLAVYGYV